MPGVVEFLGRDAATGTGVDPQTLLMDSGVARDGEDVIANASEANLIDGGVGEFQGADFPNPVVAIQGSGTADAPHIVGQP